MTDTLPGLDRDSPRVELHRRWRTAMADSRAQSVARRDRVLAHPDLAKALTEPPLSLPDPAWWSGWIPPRLLAEDTCHNCATRSCRALSHFARANDSPFRRQLVDIAAEARRRETACDQ